MIKDKTVKELCNLGRKKRGPVRQWWDLDTQVDRAVDMDMTELETRVMAATTRHIKQWYTSDAFTTTNTYTIV